jgi:hypothetical protein
MEYYVGTKEGGFVYDDGSVAQFMPGMDVYTLALAWKTLSCDYYAGTYNGLFKSDDGFQTYDYSQNGMPTGEVSLVVVDPTDPSIVYANKDGSGLYKSIDSAANWVPANTGLGSATVTNLVFDPSDSSILYAAAFNIYKSTNGGGSWSLLSGSPSDVDVLVIDPTNPLILYAGADYYGIFKSTDGGVTWVVSTTGISSCSITCFVPALAIDPMTPTILYASDKLTYSVYKSIDGGATWSDLHSSGLSGRSVDVFLFDASIGHSSDIYAGTSAGLYSLEQSPDPFSKGAPGGGEYVHLNPTLTWGASGGTNAYQYCYDTTPNGACDSGWVWTGTDRSVTLGGLSNDTTYYWQVRANNYNGTTYANGGNWRSFTAREQTFFDVPIDHSLWEYIEAFFNAGITGGCGVNPLTFCPENNVTRAAMAVFLLRAKYGSAYTPPPAGHYFADLPVYGKEWQEAWVDQFYREGITGGCATTPLAFCPEQPVTRAAMAVFILRTLQGASYTPPPASHFFADLPVAGKEWMEPWVDELYRRGITTGCGTGPLVFCPENPVKRQAMAAFIVRAFNLPLP